MNHPSQAAETGGKEITAVGVGTVRSDRVDFVLRVLPRNHAASTSATRVAPHDDNVAATWRPFALDAHEAAPDLEDEVIAPALEQRPIHPNSEANRGGSDRALGDCSLLVGGQHVSQSSSPIGQQLSR